MEEALLGLSLVLGIGCALGSIPVLWWINEEGWEDVAPLQPSEKVLGEEDVLALLAMRGKYHRR